METVCFDAEVQSVKTLVDGGIRVTFDLPENATEQAKQLMDFKRLGVPLRAVVARQDGEQDTN